MEKNNIQYQNIIIFIGDFIGVTLAYFCMTYFRIHSITVGHWFSIPNVYTRWFVAVVSLFVSYVAIDPNKDFFKRNLYGEIKCCIKMSLVLALAMGTSAFLLADARYYSRIVYITTVLLSFVWMVITHRIYRKSILKARSLNDGARQVLVITTADQAKEVVEQIIKEKIWDLWVAGVAVIDADEIGKEILPNVMVVANKDSLNEYVIRNVVDEVFLCLPTEYNDYLQKHLNTFAEMGVTINVRLNTFDVVAAAQCHLDQIANYDVIRYENQNIPLYMLFIKRVIDIAGAIVGLIITFFATLIVGPLIIKESPGPIFFSQKRVGKNGRIFKFYKFRSMYMDAEERKKELMAQNEMSGLMFKMTDDPRITKVGKFIRKTSIDELPQFWNILKGEMSLVGTRPPTVDEFEEYKGYHKRRLSMTPGLTGVWQTSGRSDIQDFEEIVAMDVDYITNWSLKRDFQIIFKTVAQVFRDDAGAR